MQVDGIGELGDDILGRDPVLAMQLFAERIELRLASSVKDEIVSFGCQPAGKGFSNAG